MFKLNIYDKFFNVMKKIGLKVNVFLFCGLNKLCV